jgi:hypothetical protein
VTEGNAVEGPAFFFALPQILGYTKRIVILSGARSAQSKDLLFFPHCRKP